MCQYFYLWCELACTQGEINTMTHTISNAQQLAQHIARQGGIDVVICIGTDKVVSDSLGPMVGTMLNKAMSRPLYIYGLCNRCITALNVAQCNNAIRSMHPNSTILAIDAGVGDDDQVGKVQISDHGIMPGLATNRQLPCVGDIGIVGIVSNRDMSQFYVNSDTRRNIVHDISKMIVDSINSAFASSIM